MANVFVCVACVVQPAAPSAEHPWTRCGRSILDGSARRASGGPQVVFRPTYLLKNETLTFLRGMELLSFFFKCYAPNTSRKLFTNHTTVQYRSDSYFQNWMFISNFFVFIIYYNLFLYVSEAFSCADKIDNGELLSMLTNQNIVPHTFVTRYVFVLHIQ